MNTKTYPHVTGLYGDNGESQGAIAVHAVLDPSENYPESGRIIVGSPGSTPTIPGYLPNLGGFNGGPDAIERLASALTEAARDVRAALSPPRGRSPESAPDDARPSIAEMLVHCRLIREGSMSESDDIEDAAPVLLEIAAAAQRWREVARAQHSTAETILSAQDALDAALAKVRP